MLQEMYGMSCSEVHVKAMAYAWHGMGKRREEDRLEEVRRRRQAGRQEAGSKRQKRQGQVSMQ